MKPIRLDGAIPEAERSQRLFAGQLLVFREVPALGALCRYSDNLLRAGFGDDPGQA